ncbi:amidohydrolase family protein [Rhizobium leguminosarum]|uniref:amidohydrolase family protein n=1 Tax=Rhizobium TaxID=379 RepID=UPI00140FA602|nr:amidohydrolase family protein [Rhizobium leguminosarum]NKL21365.1 amidohydrolase family protein [Rhizobium leguminosarum bv. viciae]QIO64113.1 amidohydrolase family protein [Rhizobium leguminosarum bv. trifolii]
MSIFEEPKIDCHAHVLDPAQFPYAEDAAYKPWGQEIGTTAQLVQVMQTYGTRHALLVQPNSGYGSDNSCMLDAIRRHPKLFKGVAIAALDAETATLRVLRDQGIIGIALNPTFHGNAYYESASGLMEKLAELDMFVQIQVEHDQLAMFRPWIEKIPVRVLIDHCGRPTPRDGLDYPGFETLLRLSDTGRVHVKLSGYAKFAGTAYPFEDTWPFLRALVGAFGLEQCMWASDWPYLRAADRQDYGPLLKLVEMLFPDVEDRRQILWETPRRLFGFGS